MPSLLMMKAPSLRLSAPANRTETIRELVYLAVDLAPAFLSPKAKCVGTAHLRRCALLDDVDTIRMHAAQPCGGLSFRTSLGQSTYSSVCTNASAYGSDGEGSSGGVSLTVTWNFWRASCPLVA